MWHLRCWYNIDVFVVEDIQEDFGPHVPCRFKNRRVPRMILTGREEGNREQKRSVRNTQSNIGAIQNIEGATGKPRFSASSTVQPCARRERVRFPSADAMRSCMALMRTQTDRCCARWPREERCRRPLRERRPLCPVHRSGSRRNGSEAGTCMA